MLGVVNSVIGNVVDDGSLYGRYPVPSDVVLG